MRSSLYSLPVAFRTSSSNAHFERAFLTRFLREHFEWTSDASQNTVSERTPNALVFECRTNNPHDHEVAVACTHKSCPVLLPPPPPPLNKTSKHRLGSIHLKQKIEAAIYASVKNRLHTISYFVYFEVYYEV